MSNDKKLLPEQFLTVRQHRALKKIKIILTSQFEVERIVLFGSVVRGEADEESDIDLLIITKQRLNRWERHQITDVVCEVNLEHSTSFSTLVIDRDTWDKGLISHLPIYQEVQREGITV